MSTKTVRIIFIVLQVGVIFFEIWTIYVANNARKEIKNDQEKNSPEPEPEGVVPLKDANDGQQIGNKVTIGV